MNSLYPLSGDWLENEELYWTPWDSVSLAATNTSAIGQPAQPISRRRAGDKIVHQSELQIPPRAPLQELSGSWLNVTPTSSFSQQKQPFKRRYRPPHTRKEKQREQRRIALLLRINEILLDHLSELQKSGEDGMVLGSIAQQEATKSGKSYKIGSLQYQRCFTSLKGNLRWIVASSAAMQRVKYKRAPPGPSVMEAPFEDPILIQLYAKLEKLFPNWKGTTSLNSMISENQTWANKTAYVEPQALMTSAESEKQLLSRNLVNSQHNSLHHTPLTMQVHDSYPAGNDFSFGTVPAYEPAGYGINPQFLWRNSISIPLTDHQSAYTGEPSRFFH